MKSIYPLLAAIACGVVLAPSLRAETQTDIWSLAGGGLNPNTYTSAPNKYQPPVLFPDAAANHGATITYTGMNIEDTGGLGSSSFPNGYGFFYTFFNAPVSFSLQTSTVLAGVETITVKFNSGGGTTFNAASLTLNFNPTHMALAVQPSDFTTSPGGSSPFGALTNYSWTWNVTGFGPSTGLSTSWTATAEHTTFADLQLIQQSVPEPSSFALVSLGVAGLVGRRRRSGKSAHPRV